MPDIDVSKYKVIYKEKVLKALVIDYIEFDDKAVDGRTFCALPSVIGILFINENGLLSALRSEAKNFQFVPRID
jgi:hypothetical protein